MGAKFILASATGESAFGGIVAGDAADGAWRHYAHRVRAHGTGKTRAVFDSLCHDYLKRIVYKLSSESGLRATTGFTKSDNPQRFEFKRESS